MRYASRHGRASADTLFTHLAKLKAEEVAAETGGGGDEDTPKLSAFASIYGTDREAARIAGSQEDDASLDDPSVRAAALKSVKIARARVAHVAELTIAIEERYGALGVIPLSYELDAALRAEGAGYTLANVRNERGYTKHELIIARELDDEEDAREDALENPPTIGKRELPGRPADSTSSEEDSSVTTPSKDGAAGSQDSEEEKPAKESTRKSGTKKSASSKDKRAGVSESQSAATRARRAPNNTRRSVGELRRAQAAAHSEERRRRSASANAARAA